MRTVLSILVLVIIVSSVALGGDLKGQVTFKGTVPAAEAVTITKDTRACGMKKEIRKVVVDKKGGLRDAVVRILGVKSKAAYTGPESVLDQVDCEFVPAVVVVPMGTALTITSADAVLHNSHAFNEDGTTAFNLAVPFKGMKLRWKPKNPGVLKVKCDAGHTWMFARIVVTENPFAAVSGDDGSFSIGSVPPGKYTVEAWHPELGKQTQEVEVPAAGQSVTFQFSAK